MPLLGVVATGLAVQSLIHAALAEAAQTPELSDQALQTLNALGGWSFYPITIGLSSLLLASGAPLRETTPSTQCANRPFPSAVLPFARSDSAGTWRAWLADAGSSSLRYARARAQRPASRARWRAAADGRRRRGGLGR